MRTLKFLSFIVTAISFFTLGLSSCLDDDQPETLYPTLGTVINTDRIIIDSDTYGLLVPTNPERFSAADANTNGQRVMISALASELQATLEEGEERKVKIIELYKVTTKDADRKTSSTDEDSGAEFGNDPIQIIGASISKDHLTVQFRLKGADNDKPHRISLLLAQDCRPDEEGLLPVELRHKANEALVKDFWSAASFRLSSVPEWKNPKVKGFKIFYNSGANARAVWTVSRH